MIGALGAELVMKLTAEQLAGINAGTLVRFGSVLRHADTGKIAGFLQEAAPSASLMLANPPLAAVACVAKVGMQVGSLVQGEVIRQGVKRVEAAVGTAINVGMGNLALTGVGIGISVAGYALLARRIDGVKQSVESMAGKLESIAGKIDHVRQDLLDADFAEVKALGKAMDEGWLLSDSALAERQWHDVARGALSQQTKFELRAGHVLAAGDYALADPLLDAMALSSGLRVAALAACNQSAAAIDAASDGARTLERLTGGVGRADLVRASVQLPKAEVGSLEWQSAVKQADEEASEYARNLREREAAVATRSAPLLALAENDVAPRSWLRSAFEEKESPFLFLPSPS